MEMVALPTRLANVCIGQAQDGSGFFISWTVRVGLLPLAMTNRPGTRHVHRAIVSAGQDEVPTSWLAASWGCPQLPEASAWSSQAPRLPEAATAHRILVMRGLHLSQPEEVLCL